MPAGRFGEDGDGRLLAKAIKLGLLVPVGQGRYEVPSPTLLAAGEELARLGVAPEATIRVLEQLSRRSEGVAEAFVKLFLEQVWRPFEVAGRPGGAPPRGPRGARAGAPARLGGAAGGVPPAAEGGRRGLGF